MVSNLKVLRIQEGLSQIKLAELLNVSQTYISQLELLQEKPSKQKTDILESLFGKDIDTILSEYKAEEVI